MNWKTIPVLLIAAPWLSLPAVAAPQSLTGSIAGVVSNAFGIPQMGATVTLFNRLDRQVGRLLTDERGAFEFASLPSDFYSLRVTLASFVPAMRTNIGVQPGIRRVMSVNMAGLLSTVELVYSMPLKQGMMHDDWKWTLRGSLATRPILRLTTERDPAPQYTAEGTSMFTHTRGIVRVSAGDSAQPPTLGSQPDLGTAFAVATSVLGNNHIELLGNLGYASASGNPTAGFSTIYSRRDSDGRSPEVSVTMRQIFLAGRAGEALTGRAQSLPSLSTMSIGMSDQLQATENLLITYGASLESVQYLDRVNFFSPYAKAAYDLEGWGVVEFGYSSGLPPTQLYAQTGSTLDVEHQRELSYVSLFPRVSARGGRAMLQRARNYEIGYSKKLGSRSIHAAVYSESTSNAALSAVGDTSTFSQGELVADMFSRASIFNAGSFQTRGYVASIQQAFGDNWNATLGYGSTGVLEATRDNLTAGDAQELRSILAPKNRHWAMVRVTGAIPGLGTRLSSSYQFMNGSSLTPGHFYLTQRMNPERGLNLHFRQPMPSMGMHGKLEATIDVRNLLAQGYQPLQLPDGRRMQLIHSPRALRGGLAVIF
ncbi:MAG: TonB-dependent receptor [Bryobacterales bacterium]|nr:TonB-dependent receptor [Bryobacterales bacterium]